MLSSAKIQSIKEYRIKGNIVGFLVSFFLTILVFLDLPLSIIQGEIQVIQSSEIISTYNKEMKSFSYGGKEYGLIIMNQSKCNGNDCTLTARKDGVIILNKLHPDRSRLLNELILFSVFPIIMLVNLLVGIGRYYANFLRKRKVQEYLSNGNKVESVLVDIIQHFRRKRRTTYTYISINPETNEEYESELYYYTNSVIPVGSKVPIYFTQGKYTGEYYMDINNFIPGDEKSIKIAQDYSNIRTNELIDKYKSLSKKGSENISIQLIALVILIGFIVIMSLGIYRVYPLGIIVLTPLYGVAIYLAYSTAQVEIKKHIVKNSLPQVGIVRSIHKHGIMRSIPFGYIPEEEKNVKLWYTPLKKGQRDIPSNITYGYAYSFVIDIFGKEYISEKIYKPFPKKAKIGCKIHIYFKNNSTDKYVIDDESIDELN